MTENEAVKNWLLVEDDVFCRQVAKAVGNDGISKLVASYKASGNNYEAANAQWTTVSSRGSGLVEAPLHEILLLLEKSIASGRDFSSVQQLAYDANGELVHACPSLNLTSLHPKSCCSESQKLEARTGRWLQIGWKRSRKTTLGCD